MAQLVHFNKPRKDQLLVGVDPGVGKEGTVLSGENLEADLTGMEYRPVVVRGVYDHSQQVALRNQSYQDRNWNFETHIPF